MVVTAVPLPLQQNTSTQTHITIHCYSWSPCANITTGHIPLAFSGMLPRPRPPRPRPLPGGTSVLTQEQGGPAYHGACHKWGHIAAHHIDRVVGDSVHNRDPLSPRWLSHHSLQRPPPEEQPAVAMPTARSAATSSAETTPLCYWSSFCDSPDLISPDHCGASTRTHSGCGSGALETRPTHGDRLSCLCVRATHAISAGGHCGSHCTTPISDCKSGPVIVQK